MSNANTFTSNLLCYSVQQHGTRQQQADYNAGNTTIILCKETTPSSSKVFRQKRNLAIASRYYIPRLSSCQGTWSWQSKHHTNICNGRVCVWLSNWWFCLASIPAQNVPYYFHGSQQTRRATAESNSPKNIHFLNNKAWIWTLRNEFRQHCKSIAPESDTGIRRGSTWIMEQGSYIWPAWQQLQNWKNICREHHIQDLSVFRLAAWTTNCDLIPKLIDWNIAIIEENQQTLNLDWKQNTYSSTVLIHIEKLFDYCDEDSGSENNREALTEYEKNHPWLPIVKTFQWAQGQLNSDVWGCWRRIIIGATTPSSSRTS